LIELAGIVKVFPGHVALRAVDLTLRAGTIHALVGENGAGKSTLINILAGVHQPDAGRILLEGQPLRLHNVHDARSRGIVAVHQEVDFFPDLTVVENIALLQGFPASREAGGVSPLGVIRWPILRQRTEEALAAVGQPVSADTLAVVLTPAQRQMVEIAAAVSQAARILILDEPTSSLSDAEVRVLFEHLRRFRARGAAILYVSHRFEEIFALADEVTVLRDGARVWTGPLASTSRARLIRDMVGREVAAGQRTARKPSEPGPVRLACRGLSADDGAFMDISLEVHGGEVLGVYGLIGAGRSEWAQTVVGLRRSAAGQILVEGRPVHPSGPAFMAEQGVVYVPEDRQRQGLCRGLSVRANTVLASLRRLARFGWLSGARERQQTEATVAQLGVRLSSIEQAISTLSGGNQQKVVLGRWLNREPSVLLLDEPTRGVDVGAREEIYAILQRQVEAGKAVVLISSDLPEVMAQSDRVLVFREGRVAALCDPRTCSAEDIAHAAFPHTPEVHPGEAAGDQEPVTEPAPRHQEIREPEPSSVENAWWRALAEAVRAREMALLLVIVVFFGLLQLLTGRFLQPENARNLLTDAALLTFCAVGAALVLLAGGLDISLGSLMALSAGVAGRLWEQGWPLPLALTVAVGVGAAGGALNAGLTLVGRVHPIVVTLGTLSVYRGLTLGWLQQDVQIAGYRRDWLVEPVLGVPLVVWLALLSLVLAWWALGNTVLGRHLMALGSNPTAAQRVSISRARIWIAAFTIQGALVGLAGLLYLARSGQLQPTSHEERTLEAIAAAVVGGVAITGGRGSVWGVALGCLFLVALGPACIFLHIDSHWQQTLVGSVMVAAVLFSQIGRGKG
jgi:ABC-type sugar transport system ATPase subunit/ribose/xylose/arabinose/galactoside ABC-type transport system permease subunit